MWTSSSIFELSPLYDPPPACSPRLCSSSRTSTCIQHIMWEPRQFCFHNQHNHLHYLLYQELSLSPPPLQLHELLASTSGASSPSTPSIIRVEDCSLGMPGGASSAARVTTTSTCSGGGKAAWTLDARTSHSITYRKHMRRIENEGLKKVTFIVCN